MMNNTQFHEGYEDNGNQVQTENQGAKKEDTFMTTNVKYQEKIENERYESDSIPTQPKQQESRKKTHKGKAGRILAMALCCAFLGGGAGAGTFALCSGAFSGTGSGTAENTAVVLQGQRENTALNLSYVDTGKEMTAAEIYAANVNSTVGITTSVTTNYFGFQTTTPASGSGFILTENGYIITNYHVVEDASEIKVTTRSMKRSW